MVSKRNAAYAAAALVMAFALAAAVSCAAWTLGRYIYPTQRTHDMGTGQSLRALNPGQALAPVPALPREVSVLAVLLFVAVIALGVLAYRGYDAGYRAGINAAARLLDNESHSPGAQGYSGEPKHTDYHATARRIRNLTRPAAK